MKNHILIKSFLLLLFPLGISGIANAGEVRITYSDRHHSHSYDRHYRSSDRGVSHYDKKRLRERVYGTHRSHRIDNHSYNRTHRYHDRYYSDHQYRRHDHYRSDRKRHHYARRTDLGYRRYDRSEPRYCR